MRRKDREIADRAQIDEILNASRVMHLALADQNVPFLVPLFYAYDGSSIYFHSANVGTKIEILQRNPKVCFEVSVDQGVIPADAACDFEARHRTVIGFGEASFVEDHAEKVRILDLIVGRFTDKRFTYPEANLLCTKVVRIGIASIRGKKHGF
jgi:hypothetical protein